MPVLLVSWRRDDGGVSAANWVEGRAARHAQPGCCSMSALGPKRTLRRVPNGFSVALVGPRVAQTPVAIANRGNTRCPSDVLPVGRGIGMEKNHDENGTDRPCGRLSEAEAPHVAQAAQAAEGRMGVRASFK